MSTGGPANPLTAEALPEILRWPDRPTPADLDPLPGIPAIYLLLDAHDQPVQLATTQNLKRLATARLLDETRAQRGQADLAAIARAVRWRRVAAPFESRWWYYRLVRQHEPKSYRQLIGFGPAWFLHVDWHARVPEVRVTERVWCAPGHYVGPFPARRQAQHALEGLWDLFDLCRYPEQVRKAPSGQRCAYAEMNRCDAPCDGSVPLEPYIARCRQAWSFAGGHVAPWIAAAEQAMQAAARQLAFERANVLKQQLAFAREWQQKWLPVVRPAEDFNLLLAVAVTRRKARKLFLFSRGALVEGPTVPDRKLVADTRAWLEPVLRDHLPAALAAADPTQRMEQTWLVAHLLQNKEAATTLTLRLPNLPQDPIPTTIDQAHQSLEESVRMPSETQ